jgi:Tol biopolymer transport system component
MPAFLMTLAPGSRLGPYEIVAAVGAGGMGEVYRARDTKLNRVVALKILPDAFAADADRLMRFRREAQVLASLNHPSIAHLYGFEDAGSTQALVMELVDGPTLADRIARGPIPLAEALPIARQIAEALEAAHEQGIVHRDLKPANVKVRDDGTVKVLDFGLAKALDPATASSAEAMNSTTVAARATQLGVILGTAAYMAPEQARGKVVDKRADIWSFGVVLDEMLTGQRLFKGEGISDVLAAVLRQDIAWTALPAGTPLRLTRLLGRCLDRDLRERLRDIGEARVEIAKILAGAPDSAVAPAPASAAVRRSAVARVLPWTFVAMGWIGLLAALLIWSPWRSTSAPLPRTLAASLGADASFDIGFGTFGATAQLSPDGTMLAFAAQQAGKTWLFIRKLDQLLAAPLAGTEGAADPFFSPDGRWIAFFADGHLRKIPTTGGAAVNVCDAPAARGGTWTDDNSIIFCPTNGSNTRLVRVSAAGGVPAVVGTLGDGATTQRWPQALPGGAGVLYTESSNIGAWDGANLVVAPLSGGAPKIVVGGGYYGRYVPSGHLIYMQHGTLFAVPFDLRLLETLGPAVPALEGVTADAVVGAARLSVSTEGTLVYVPGAAADQANPVNWMTRDGKMSVLRATKVIWANPRFSPDGQRLALDIFDGQRNIWVYEWARDTPTQLTFGSLAHFPVWTPDGRRVTFASDRDKAVGNLYWVNADGTGDVTRLTNSPNAERAYSWHPSGKFLAFQANRPGTGWDLMILPIEGDAARGWAPGTPTVFLSTSAAEQAPMFSPDGRWIAYQSNEASGRFEVYVRPFPGGDGKWRVSTDGGTEPRWSASTQELLFLNRGRVMVASYTVAGDSLRMDTPRVWSPTTDRILASGYDLHPDGQRLASLAAPDQGLVVRDKVVFVFNFFDYLRKIAPARK